MKESIKITVGQIGNFNIEDPYDVENGLSYKNPMIVWGKIQKAVQIAEQNNSDFLILPEIMVPRKYIKSHIPTICNNSNLIIIGGIEFYEKGMLNGQKIIQNEAFIAIPGVGKEGNLRERAMVWRTPKLYPSYGEETLIKEHGYNFYHGNKMYIFKSEEYGNWAVLICVDYLNLPIHQILQKKIQTLFILAFNKDLNYYYSMSDALHRVLYCNIVVCNAANYGGSHIFTPYRQVHKREVLKMHGNKVETAVTVKLPLKILKDIQEAPRDKEFEGFVKKPSDYEFIR